MKNSVENDRIKQELDEVMLDLENKQTILKIKLLETDFKLDTAKDKLKNLSNLSVDLHTKKDDSVTDFTISTIILLCVILIFSIVPINLIFYLFVAAYIYKIPKYIRLYKIITKKELEILEKQKDLAKEKIEELSTDKKHLEEELRRIYLSYENTSVKKEILEEMSIYCKQVPQDQKDFQRKRINKKVI